jgi:hypothetical protein
MGVLLVLRWLWWRVNAWGELASIAASAVLAPILLAVLSDDREALRLLWMAGGSTLAGIAASVATAPESRERLHAFYRTARPPGFWSPIATEAGAEPRRDARRLARGLGAVAAAALCVFCLLTGLGSWLAGSPAPPWLPSRPAWIALLLALGALLVPVWIALGKGIGDDVNTADPERVFESEAGACRPTTPEGGTP